MSAVRWAEGGFAAAAQRVLREGITMVDVTGKHMVIPPGQIKVVMEEAPSPIAGAGLQYKVAPEAAESV